MALRNIGYYRLCTGERSIDGVTYFKRYDEFRQVRSLQADEDADPIITLILHHANALSPMLVPLLENLITDVTHASAPGRRHGY